MKGFKIDLSVLQAVLYREKHFLFCLQKLYLTYDAWCSTFQKICIIYFYYYINGIFNIKMPPKIKFQVTSGNKKNFSYEMWRLFKVILRVAFELFSVRKYMICDCSSNQSFLSKSWKFSKLFPELCKEECLKHNKWSQLIHTNQSVKCIAAGDCNIKGAKGVTKALVLSHKAEQDWCKTSQKAKYMKPLLSRSSRTVLPGKVFVKLETRC